MSITKPSRKAGIRVAGIGVIGAAILVAANGPGVFAGLKAEAVAANPMAATTGTLQLDLNGKAAFAANIDKLAPGDTVTRYVDLANSGTLAAQALKVKVEATGDAVLTSGAKSLTMQITSCDVAWTSGACSGTEKNQAPEASVATFSSMTDFTNSVDLAADNGALFLKVVFALPASIDETTTDGTLPADTVQGKAASLKVTFQESQRTKVDTDATVTG